MVLDKKTPKEIYDWLMDEAFAFHESDEEIMDKVRKKTTAIDRADT